MANFLVLTGMAVAEAMMMTQPRDMTRSCCCTLTLLLTPRSGALQVNMVEHGVHFSPSGGCSSMAIAAVLDAILSCTCIAHRCHNSCL